MAKRTITPPATALTVAAFAAGLVAPAGPAFADEGTVTVRAVDDGTVADDPLGPRGGWSTSAHEFVGILEAARRASGESTVFAVPADSPGGCRSDPGPAQTQLPATGGSPAVVWTVGAAAILTGAVIALAVRGRRRLLRGADYW
ncbi:LPXTG-motif cell wall-anchored protein [Stackebrandtia endophytica]|uniref:LPXTG-motif cell wall-anchored protein n=1 Tax=Stackebrandtia endophytica TaxID=1496996 RepID=A0A543B277_9ACTN|nr:LPXTG cell wall anchor domain-containing protein [Stackebrandtia endophytica]TQL78932.1 LPXTG-motif cell wall-anchored protein [Stackebrandtia endophytica]